MCVVSESVPTVPASGQPQAQFAAGFPVKSSTPKRAYARGPRPANPDISGP